MKAAIYSCLRVLVLPLALALALPALAWTDKPIRMIVPAPPGGTSDAVARIVADQLSKEIGQPVIVDNKPGAGGAIGIKTMLAQPHDGQTIMMTTSNVLVEVPHVLKGGFDPLKDVKLVATVARTLMVFVGSPTVPAKDVKGVITYVKSNPGKVSYASYSTGTASHYAGAILNKQTGLDMQHIPFPGSAPALVQVMGGQIPLMFDGLVTSKSLVLAGKLQIYGVAYKTRSSHFPQVPTLAEQGFPDLDFSNWAGIVIPADVPTELSEKMHSTLAKVASSPKVRDRMVEAGFEAVSDQSISQLAQEVRAEYERNAAIVKAFDIRMNQ